MLQRFTWFSISVLVAVMMLTTSVLMVTSQSVQAEIPIYTPKVDGAPTRRVGGGSRGISDVSAMPFVAVLAPESTGHTVNAQPVLYWYISKSVNKSFNFILEKEQLGEIDLNNLEEIGRPLLDIDVENPSEGIHAVDLAEHNVSLEPGVAYRWSISSVYQTSTGIMEVSSSAEIVLTEESTGLEGKLQATADKQHPFIYARAGYWYDAIHALSELMDKYPEESNTFAQQRAGLLKQVDLHLNN